MALDTNFSQGPETAAPAQDTGAGGFSNQTAQSRQNREVKFSFSQGKGFEDMAPPQNGTAAINAIKKLFEEKYKDTNIKPMVIPFLRESFGMQFNYSSLIVAASSLNVATGAMNVAYHILLIESSNPAKPDNYKVNTDRPGIQINIPRHACDGLDSDYTMAARSLVERTYRANAPEGTKTLHILYAHAEVVPDTFRLDDLEKVSDLAINALMAVTAQLRSLTTQAPLNLADTETTPFVIEHNFRDGSVNDLNDQAVRSDVIVRMTARVPGKRNQFGLNGGAGGNPVSTTSLYMDLMYTENNNNSGQLLGQPKKVEPCFVPRAVITNSICYQGYSLEMYLLQLYAAHNVYDSGAYQRSIINKQKKKGDLFDMSDIGAANVLANINNEASAFGTAYETRSPEVTDAFKSALFRTVTQQIPLLAIDCQLAGPSSWQTAALHRASHQNKEGRDAEQDLIQAAMNLTDGAFARNFPEGTRVIAYREIVPMGQWTDTEGQERDIREYDTLAILNRYTNESPEQVAKWITAQNDTTRSEEMRLTDIISVIDDASGYRARYNSRAVRVTLHPAFMFALREGIKAAGKHTFSASDVFVDASANNLRGAQFLNWSQLAGSPMSTMNGYNRAGMDSMMHNSVFSNIFSV